MHYGIADNTLHYVQMQCIMGSPGDSANAMYYGIAKGQLAAQNKGACGTGSAKYYSANRQQCV
jgi:hypothetical protein